MNYSDMIKTENSDSCYKAWGEYRQELTKYILSCLHDNCSKNSWIAIWGAGGCNDIEITELAKDYKLLLIDQDLEKLCQVRERLGLGTDNCKVADVGFWPIEDEDYQMFQALLMDGADYEEIDSFLSDLIKNMPAAIDLESYSVEGSVVIGLASQLNARFAAMLHLYRDKISQQTMERLAIKLKEMNRLATNRLYISLRQITKTLVITGYETKGCYSEAEAQEEIVRLQELLEDGADGGKYLSGEEGREITVAGNEFWHSIIYKTIIMDQMEDIGRCQLMCWPFSNEKYYPMLMVSLIITR